MRYIPVLGSLFRTSISDDYLQKQSTIKSRKNFHRSEVQSDFVSLTLISMTAKGIPHTQRLTVVRMADKQPWTLFGTYAVLHIHQIGINRNHLIRTIESAADCDERI